MKALILAGGRGERMGKITESLPKPMLKIGGFPILEHQINLLKRYGLKEVIILTHYFSEVIENYFRDGKEWGVKISYWQEKKPLGTTGGIKEIADKLKDDFLVIYGDKMLDMDLARVIAFHKNKKSACTLVLHQTSHLEDSDLVEIDGEQKIIAFHPKPHSPDRYFRNLVNTAVYIMSPKILRHIRQGVKADFGKDIFPKIVKKENLYGYLSAEYIKDIGTPARLAQARKDYEKGKVGRLNKKNRRRAIFLDRDGVINKYVEELIKPEDFGLLPGAAGAVKKINDSEFLAIVISNQPVVAKKLCSIRDIEEIHKKMETLLAKNQAKLDAIYYCPHHPDYDIKCSCRKPEIGLVKKAVEEFNIDLKNSYLVGDSFRDILCAKKAGLTSICVKTGHGCRGIDVKPDYLFNNLGHAVDFITNYKKTVK
ncbi:MAG: HAD-IIIA family hydrolase [Candidatus Nealsonbacteria bacterium]